MKRAIAALGILALLGPVAFAPIARAGDDSKMSPDVGKDAPELQTKEWINSEGRTSFADTKGEVTLVAAWKTG